MRSIHRALVSFAEKQGLARVRITRAGMRTHPRLTFEHGGREHNLPVPGTTSNYFAEANAKSALRRYLRGTERWPGASTSRLAK